MVPPQVINNHKLKEKKKTHTHTKPPSLWATNSGLSWIIKEKRTLLRYLASAPSCYISSFLLSCLCVPQVSLETSTLLPGQFSISPTLDIPYQLVPPRPVHQCLHLLFTCSPQPCHSSQPTALGTGHWRHITTAVDSSDSFPWFSGDSFLRGCLYPMPITCSHKMCCF